MGWVKLDDNFPDHPKVERAGYQAGWLYVCGLTYCSRFLTDGFIPADRLPRLSSIPKPQQAANALVREGLWYEAPGGWVVHNYDRWQRTAEQVEAERTSAKVRANKRRGSPGVTSKFDNQIDTDRENPPNPPHSGGNGAALNPRAAGTNPRAKGKQAEHDRRHRDGEHFVEGTGWVSDLRAQA